MRARCTTQLNTCPPPTSASSSSFALLSNPSQAHPKPKKADQLPTISASHRTVLLRATFYRTRGDTYHIITHLVPWWAESERIIFGRHSLWRLTLLWFMTAHRRWWSFEPWVRPLWEFYHFYITPHLIDSNSFRSVVCFSALICQKLTWMARVVMCKTLGREELWFSHPRAALY